MSIINIDWIFEFLKNIERDKIGPFLPKCKIIVINWDQLGP